MLTVIDKKTEIAHCQSKVRAAVTKIASEHHRHRVGFPSGTFEADIWYVKKLDFWVAFEDWGDRFCNACGIGYPFSTASPAPHLEINPPTKGINRRTAGLFVRDAEGTRYLAHSGKVGGGTKGVSPTNFRAYFPAHMAVDWGGVEHPAYVVGDVDDPALVQNMRDLTLISKQFREAVKAGLVPKLLNTESSKAAHTFNPEFEGTKTFTTKEQVIARVNHGKIVKALRDVLESNGVHVFNDVNRDLYVNAGDGSLRTLFEIKTGSTTTKVYEAIGQLLYHSNDGVQRVAVLPSDISVAKSSRLATLGIRLLTYSWSKNGNVQFQHIDEIIKELSP